MSSSTTSPAATYASVGFADSEKADVRRFCGYPTYGGEGNTGFQGWRYYTDYGLLEFRMNNLAPAEFQNVRYFLAACFVLETALLGAGANLDTDQAAVWTHNKAEVRDRTRLLDQWRRKLCIAVGVPPGPELDQPGIRFVV